jgi:cytochrome b involved in lipid metabolism
VVLVASAISLSQVATHNSNSDCWSVIYGTVYDITFYAPRHPNRGGGADQVYRMCGIDSTTLYDAFHGDNPEWLDEFSSITNLGPVTMDNINPCESSPCRDYETCLNMGSGDYQCQYNDPCESSPCQDYETCLDMGSGDFQCLYNDPCESSPCQDYETCLDMGNGDFQCQYKDPCSVNPCQEDSEVCIDLGSGTFRCQPNSDENPCNDDNDSPCQSFEECVYLGSGGDYQCRYIDPCSRSTAADDPVCKNFERCVDLGEGEFRCDYVDPCAAGATGVCESFEACFDEGDGNYRCDYIVPCTTMRQDCQENEECIDLGSGSYLCQSLYVDRCVPNPCESSQICISVETDKLFECQDNSYTPGGSNGNPEQESSDEAGSDIVISLLELQMHSAHEDCWVSYFGEVYSMTNYAPRHPVGSGMIFAVCGWDGTSEYSKYHEKSLLGIIQEHYIGQMDPYAVFEVTDGNELPTELVAISLEELASHNSTSSCWIAYYDEVYDLTTYGHPVTPFGQSLIYMSCGKDGTRNYTAVHPRDILDDTVEDFKIGWLEEESSFAGKASADLSIFPPFMVYMMMLFFT